MLDLLDLCALVSDNYSIPCIFTLLPNGFVVAPGLYQNAFIADQYYHLQMEIPDILVVS